MDSEIITSIIVSSGIGTLGVAFMIKKLVTTGIQKAVELNFNKHLEAYKTTLSKELESLKSTLKNSEVFFVRQLEALSMLRGLFRKILPEKSCPDGDWDEALEHIADNFKKHRDTLIDYLCAYEAVLPTEVREKLESACYAVSDIRFYFELHSSTNDAVPSTVALEYAKQFYDLVEESIQQFQAQIENQLGYKPGQTSVPKAKTEIAL
ncbi:hypothetical protein JFU48_27260 [Pseudomonas sp. TH49]|uniref:hypothetical protein n=1 Tax=Pseudomonas sp. TH49 TaxID=2796413 RepID=UPI001912F23F|nr:hypothetical protein [Pseudomonas sp. TH49]MBK5345040.1 hypothetical protein [Pseudomonas sp. TH49]